MDKKTILAFVIIGIIIILMPYYYKMLTPESARQQKAVQEIEGKRTEPALEQIREQTHEEVLVEEPFTSAPEEVQAGFGWQDTTVRQAVMVRVETPLYIATFSSQGAKLVSFRLKEYDDRRGGMTEMILIGEGREPYYPNGYLKFYRMNLSTDEFYYDVSNTSLSVEAGESAKMVFTAKLANGGYIRNTYVFDGVSYQIGLSTESGGIRLDDEYYFCWDGGVNVTETDTIQDLSYSKAYAMMGGELEKLDAPGRGEKRLNPSGTVDWIAVRSKYFQIAVIPEGNSAGIDFVAKKLGHQKNSMKAFELAMKMKNPSHKLNQEYTLYIGPLDSKLMSELGVGLESTMNWGWSIIKPFSKLVLWSFKLLHKLIPNYGLVIIVFSVLIKVLLWPLTHKSYVSMKKMSGLQPYLKELKEKHKGDPAKIQKATAQLYKEHGVNPLGGCLPTLLQMPLLIALFQVFRTTIELRGEPFFLWIQDLSLPDSILNLGFSIPLYGSHVAVLPILMGVSTYYQSKSTITDPNQKMMLYFMPIFLLLMFNNFPSGLTLYYTLFNVLSVFQQRMVHTNNKPNKGKDVKKKA